MADGYQIFNDTHTPPHFIGFKGDTQLVYRKKKFGGFSAYFDGYTDSLTIPDHADWNMGTSDFTIDFWWMKTNANNGTLLSRRSDVTPINNCYIVHYANTTVGVKIGNGSSGLTWTTAAVTINTWHHFALTRSGSNFYVFIDGKLQSSQQSAIAISLSAGNGLMIGNNEFFSGEDLQGYVDEYRIYKNVAKWTSSFTVPARSYAIDPYNPYLLKFNNTTLDARNDHLVAAWKFDDNANVVSDIVCRYHGTTGGGILMSQTGKNGYCSLFNGGDSVVNMGALSGSFLDFGWGDSFTFSTWIKTAQASGNYRVIIRKTDGGTGYNITVNDGKIRVHLSSVWGSSMLVVDSSNVVNDNSWHHVVVTYDGSHSANGLKVWLDGVNSSTIVTNNLTGDFKRTSELFQFGQGTPGWNSYLGLIDETCVWNVVLSNSEIATLYNSGTGTFISEIKQFGEAIIDGFTPNMISYYTMGDEGPGITDELYRNHGEQNGTVTYEQSGKNGYAIRFDGSTGSFNIPSPSGMPIGNQAYSVAFWVKGNSWSNDAGGGINCVLFGRGNDSGTGYMQAIAVGTDGRIRLLHQGITVNTGMILSLGVWHHVVVTFNGTIERLYVDHFSSQLYNLGSLNVQSTDIKIGRHPTSTCFFNGLLDEISVWNTALSMDAMNSLWNNGYGRFLVTTGRRSIDMVPEVTKVYMEKEVLGEVIREDKDGIQCEFNLDQQTNIVVWPIGNYGKIPLGWEYNRKGLFNDRSWYHHSSFDLCIWWSDTWGGHWWISPIKKGQTPADGLLDRENSYAFYRASSDVPPITGWTVNNP